MVTPKLNDFVERIIVGHLKQNLSASSHTAKMTLKCLNKCNVNYITPAKWMLKSPDAAPMDFGIWGIV